MTTPVTTTDDYPRIVPAQNNGWCVEYINSAGLKTSTWRATLAGAEAVLAAKINPGFVQPRQPRKRGRPTKAEVAKRERAYIPHPNELLLGNVRMGDLIRMSPEGELEVIRR